MGDAADQPGENVVRDGVAGAFVQARSIAGGVHVHSARAERPVPRQLLAAPRYFVGRGAELARLTADLDSSAGGTVVISALAGAGGIGKTALALHWAHRNLDRFPDGQLFVDLQGFSSAGEPVDPAVAVRGFLSALGVELGQVPVDLPAQAALYRSMVAGRRMLIVLDNAADITQVMPLLPGSPSCTVLVTSRRSLTGLVTRQGAHSLLIGVLTDTEARELLVTRIGADRISAEAGAVDKLVACCGGFALALDIVAGRADMNPAIPLTELAAELRDATISALDDDEPAASLPAVLSWSLRALTEEQANTLVLLGIAPGVDISLPTAANLMGVDLNQTRRVLRALVEASLLTVDARGRYSMHDLIRGYVTNIADRLPGTVRVVVLQRVVDFYLHTAYDADRLFYAHRPSIQLAPPVPGTVPHALPDASAALAWFDAEHVNLLTAQQSAAQHGWHQVVWQLAWTMVMFHACQGHREHRHSAWRVALTAAGHLTEPATRILIHRNLGRAAAEAGRYDEGVEHLHEALAVAERHDDVYEQAYVHGNLAWVWESQGNYQTALAHGRRAVHLRRALGDQVGEANALHLVGWCAARLGQYRLARAYSLAALDLHRHHRHGEAIALSTLGYVAHHSGEHQQAVQYYEQAAILFRGTGNIVSGANVAKRLGASYLAIGEHDRARAAWQEALELFRRQGRTDTADLVQQRLDDLDEQQG